jgi:hypothetical protein
VALRQIGDAGIERSNETPNALGGLAARAFADVQKCLKSHTHDIGVLALELTGRPAERRVEFSWQPNGDLVLHACTLKCIVVHCMQIIQIALDWRRAADE